MVSLGHPHVRSSSWIFIHICGCQFSNQLNSIIFDIFALQIQVWFLKRCGTPHSCWSMSQLFSNNLCISRVSIPQYFKIFPSNFPPTKGQPFSVHKMCTWHLVASHHRGVHPKKNHRFWSSMSVLQPIRPYSTYGLWEWLWKIFDIFRPIGSVCMPY